MSWHIKVPGGPATEFAARAEAAAVHHFTVVPSDTVAHAEALTIGRSQFEAALAAVKLVQHGFDSDIEGALHGTHEAGAAYLTIHLAESVATPEVPAKVGETKGEQSTTG